jgi:anthranilate synthase component 1
VGRRRHRDRDPHAVIQDGRLHVQAGAGIVHDSDPQKEWDET